MRQGRKRGLWVEVVMVSVLVTAEGNRREACEEFGLRKSFGGLRAFKRIGMNAFCE